MRTRVALSWAAYWTGDAVSRAMDRYGRITPLLYPIYNRLMLWAVDLQGDDPDGPWEPETAPTSPARVTGGQTTEKDLGQ